MQRIFEVAPRPRLPVTALLIDPDVSRPITTGPGNSGTFPQAISAALCSARLDLLRNIVIRVQVRSKVLVRELLRSANLRLVSNPVSNVNTIALVASTSCRNSVFKFIRSACGPILRASAAQTFGPWQHRTTSPIGRCRVHQQSMLVLLRFLRVSVRDQRLNFNRKSSPPAGAHFSTSLPVKPTEHRSASVILRRRSSHTQDVPQARNVTDRRAQ